MNQDELKALIKKHESQNVEFKKSWGNDLLESVAMLANAHGGIVLIGVSNECKVVGVDIGKETITKWTNKIAQNTEPRIIADIEPDNVDGTSIAIVHVDEASIKPVAIGGKYLKRVEKGKQRIPLHEIAQMNLDSVGKSWDTLPAAEASIDDIDLERVKLYVTKANETRGKKIGADETPVQVLESLELLKEGHPTWAALLLFGRAPQRFVPQAVVHCGRFKEEIVIVDDRMIEGTVIDQVEEIMDFIRKNMSVKFVMTGKPARDEVWEYPLEALREAVTNAVCHRDYTNTSMTDIRIYDDALMVWNPGGLPSGITIEDLCEHHRSIPRNKGISRVFHDVGMIEQWGGGIGLMRQACREAGIPEPQFEEYQGFRVTFRMDVWTEEYLQDLGLNERQIKAVRYVKERGKIANKNYQELNNISRQMATIDLTELVNKGIFAKVGKAGKGITYQLTKLPNK